MGINKIVKIVSAIGIGAILVAGGAITTGNIKNNVIQDQIDHIVELNNQVEMLENREPVIKEIEVLKEIEVIKEVEVLKEVEVEVIKEIEVEKIVEIDNKNMDFVLNHIYDNNGNVEYLLDDLKDDEIEQIVDRITFVNDIKSLAEREVYKELADELDNEEIVFNNETIKFDEKEIERIRVQNDADEIKIASIDFEDNDAEVEVEGYFEQDDVKYKALCTVEFRDGKVDDIKIENVEMR